MKQSQTKKVYIYPIKDTDGTPLDLINVLTHVSSTGVSNAGGERKATGKAQKLILDRVDTFIVKHDRGEYIKVALQRRSSNRGKNGRQKKRIRGL